MSRQGDSNDTPTLHVHERICRARTLSPPTSEQNADLLTVIYTMPIVLIGT